MTPEKDVNPDTAAEREASTADVTVDDKSGRAATPDTATPNAEAAEAVAQAQTETGADASTDGQDTTDELVDEAGQTSEPAANSSHATAVESAINDDPLNFGDQRLPGVEAAADGQASEQDSIESLRAGLHAAESKATENYDRLLRLQAEMENQRKRAQKEVVNARKFALESMVDDLLPVKDSLEMGLTAAKSEDSDLGKIVEGSELTLKMLSQAFEKYNIFEINPIDEMFDPTFHQAMSVQEVEGKETNTVTSVLQKGYTLNERLIRPALVMVAK